MTRELLSFGCYLVFIIAGIVAIWSLADSFKKIRRFVSLNLVHYCTCDKPDCGGGCENGNRG